MWTHCDRVGRQRHRGGKGKKHLLFQFNERERSTSWTAHGMRISMNASHNGLVERVHLVEGNREHMSGSRTCSICTFNEDLYQ